MLHWLFFKQWKMYRHPNDEDKCVVELRVDTLGTALDNTNIYNSQHMFVTETAGTMDTNGGDVGFSFLAESSSTTALVGASCRLS